MERKRLIDRTLHQVTNFPSVEAFLESEIDPRGVLTIHDGFVPIDILVSPAQSDTTICFFHGAIEKHFTLPVLSGLGISGGVSANRVFVSDPSLILDEELLLAWYAGNFYQEELQNTLTIILRRIVEELGSQRIVFFGGSGGGFAALYFASQFAGSTALVFNPQTNIGKYEKRAIDAYVEKGFLMEPSGTAPLSRLPGTIVTDLCALYTSARPVTVGYLQNLNDVNHVNRHLLPFLRAVNPATDVSLLAERWNDGHTPPPKKLLSNILDKASISNEALQDEFKHLGAVSSRDLITSTSKSGSEGETLVTATGLVELLGEESVGSFSDE